MDLPMFYDEKEEWSQAVLVYDSALREINTKLEILSNEFKLTYRYNPIEHITSRIKSPQSIAKKIRHKGIPLTIENIVKYINDVAGIRIICSFTSDIYRIANLIAKQSDVKVLKVKDYIMCPKNNGYMSYHMIVSVPIFLSKNVIETKVEIQIRTIAMDFWASLEHKIYYKFEGNAPARIQKELKECADIVSYLDQKMLSINEDIQAINHEQDSNVTSEAFQDTIKASYGTVYKEESEETEYEVVSAEETQQIVDDVDYVQYESIKDSPTEDSNTAKKSGKKESSSFFFRKKEQKRTETIINKSKMVAME